MQDSFEPRKELQCRLYKFLLEKYSDAINAEEKKTIGEVKSLISPDDLTVQTLLSDLKPEEYSFPGDYLPTLKKVFEFIASEIQFVESGLGLNFWLSPKEIFSLKVSDDSDLAVLLCSFMSALGDENAFVVASELEDLSTHSFVITEVEGNFFLLDPSQRHSFEEFSGDKTRVMLNYSFKGSKIRRFIYKFNAEEYEQFAQD